MTAVLYRFRADVRRRWRAWVAVALVVGLAGGVVLALLAGARRTDSAYGRFLETHNAYDLLLVSGIPGLFEFAPLDFDEIAAAEEVADAAPLRVTPMAGFTPDGMLVTPGSTNFGSDPTGRYGVELNRFKVLEGRLNDPTRHDEIVVNFPAADALSLSVGDTMRVNVLDADEQAAAFGGGASLEELARTGADEDLTVVGIVAEPNGFPPPSDPTVDLEFIYLSPALLARHPDAPGVDALAVRLRGGPAAAQRFIATLQDEAGDAPVAASTSDQQTTAVGRALAPLSRALLVAAGVAAAVAVLIIGQILARQAFTESGDIPTLRALGLSRRESAQLRMLKAGAIGAIAAVVAVIVGVALSPAFPVGLARRAEPDPGLDLDWLVLGVGGMAVLVVAVSLGGVASWAGGLAAVGTSSRGLGADARGLTGSVARALRTAARGPTSLAGAGLTIGQRGTASSVLGVAVGLFTVIGMLTFVAGLNRLRDTPALYGWTWDLTVGGDFGEPIPEDGIERLASDPDVRALEVGTYVDLDVDGQRLRTLALEPRVGSLQPALTAGRAPQGRGEILLAPNAATGLDVGDRTVVEFGGRSVPATVAGRAALPGVDLLVPFDTVRALSPDASPQLITVVLADGVDPDEFGLRATEALGLEPDNVEHPALPQDLVNFGRIDDTPLVVAGLMVLVAVGTLLHALLTTVQRGRGGLAVLRTLGYTRRQVIAVVNWQAILLVVAALIIAVPLGIAAGRWVWLTVADGLGVVPHAVVPLTIVGLAAAAAVLLGAVAGFPGAWRAGRGAPAAALRGD